MKTGNTMLRYCPLLFLFALLYGTTASPYKSWEKAVDTAAQDTRYENFNGKMLGHKEVEPLEDLDFTEADIDPSMLIRKAFKQFNQEKHNKPEEDKDKLYHPSETQDTVGSELPDAILKPLYAQAQLYQEAEKDMDDVYHNTQDLVFPDDPKNKQSQESGLSPAKLREDFVYTSPEEDKDDFYHGGFVGDVVEPQAPLKLDLPNQPSRVYTEPEEDLDPLFHN